MKCEVSILLNDFKNSRCASILPSTGLAAPFGLPWLSLSPQLRYIEVIAERGEPREKNLEFKEKNKKKKNEK